MLLNTAQDPVGERLTVSAGLDCVGRALFEHLQAHHTDNDPAEEDHLGD